MNDKGEEREKNEKRLGRGAKLIAISVNDKGEEREKNEKRLAGFGCLKTHQSNRLFKFPHSSRLEECFIDTLI